MYAQIASEICTYYTEVHGPFESFPAGEPRRQRQRGHRRRAIQREAGLQFVPAGWRSEQVWPARWDGCKYTYIAEYTVSTYRFIFDGAQAVAPIVLPICLQLLRTLHSCVEHVPPAFESKFTLHLCAKLRRILLYKEMRGFDESRAHVLSAQFCAWNFQLPCCHCYLKRCRKRVDAEGVNIAATGPTHCRVWFCIFHINACTALQPHSAHAQCVSFLFVPTYPFAACGGCLDLLGAACRTMEPNGRKMRSAAFLRARAQRTQLCQGRRLKEGEREQCM